MNSDDMGLRSALERPADFDPAPPDIDRIRRAGGQRRRRRTAGTITAAAASVIVLAGGAALTLSGTDQTQDAASSGRTAAQQAADPPLVKDRGELLTKTMETVPGARRVGDLAVLVPASTDEDPPDPAPLRGPTARLGVRAYEPVWVPDRTSLPQWLVVSTALVQDKQRSTVAPVLVDRGPQSIGCVEMSDGGASCVATALLHQEGSVMVAGESMAPRGYLQAGEPTQVFTFPTLVDGQPRLLLIAGVGGVVDRAEFVAQDGTKVPAQVDADNVAPGASLMWATLPQTPARVISYRADGTIVDNHALSNCTDGASCEVR